MTGSYPSGEIDRVRPRQGNRDAWIPVPRWIPAGSANGPPERMPAPNQRQRQARPAEIVARSDAANLSRMRARTSLMLHRPANRSYASALAGPDPHLVGQLLNLAGLADHSHRKRVRGGLIDLRLEVCRHLQQVGALLGDLRLCASPPCVPACCCDRLFGAGAVWVAVDEALAPGGSIAGRGNGLLRMGSKQPRARRKSQRRQRMPERRATAPGFAPGVSSLSDPSLDSSHSLTVRREDCPERARPVSRPFLRTV